jgi:dCMP deaminase
MKKAPPKVVPSFDDYYMGLCYFIAARSKDPSTQHGSVIVDGSNIPLGWGYNGIPQKMQDRDISWRRPDKYPFIIHAEQNAIDHATCGSHRFVGGTIYITGMPCIECAKRIVTKKLRKVIYGYRSSNMVPKEVADTVKEIFKLSNVTLEQYKGNMHWIRDVMVSLEYGLPEAF